MFVSIRNLSPGCVFTADRPTNATSIATCSCPSRLRVTACSSSNGDSVKSNGGKKKGSSVPSSNYVVPLDKSFASTYPSSITRPLAEILRDFNKKIPGNIIKQSVVAEDYQEHGASSIPWYHANQMLSFHAPGTS